MIELNFDLLGMHFSIADDCINSVEKVEKEREKERVSRLSLKLGRKLLVEHYNPGAHKQCP